MNTFKNAFLMHKSLIVASLIYTALITAFVFYYGGSVRQYMHIVGFYLTSTFLAVFFVFALLSYFLLAAFYETRGGPVTGWPAAAIGNFERKLVRYGESGLPYQAFWGFLALLPLMTFFSMAKSMITHIAPYRWDPFLSKADKWLHFGYYPHELLMPLANYGWVTARLEDAYLVWFFVMFGANGICLFCDTNAVRRMRYLWSYFLCWTVGGTLIAFLFSSCGPVFYSMFYHGQADPYEKLDLWLQSARNGHQVETMAVARFLYDMVADNSYPDLNGISAMPSLHVAIAWLVALYAYSIYKPLGIILGVYGFVILAASVVLGWHYALDGYAGIACASLAWWVSGRWLARRTVAV